MEALLNMLVGSAENDGLIEQLNAILQGVNEKIFLLLIACVIIGIIAIVSLIIIAVLSHRMNILNKKFNELNSKLNLLSK